MSASPHLGTDLQLLRLFQEIEDIDHPLIVKDAPIAPQVPKMYSFLPKFYEFTQKNICKHSYHRKRRHSRKEVEVILMKLSVRGLDLEDIIIIDSQIIIEEGDHHLVLCSPGRGPPRGHHNQKRNKLLK